MCSRSEEERRRPRRACIPSTCLHHSRFGFGLNFGRTRGKLRRLGANARRPPQPTHPQLDSLLQGYQFIIIVILCTAWVVRTSPIGRPSPPHPLSITLHDTDTPISTPIHVSSTHKMNSSGTKLQLLFDAALQSYEKQTGMKLIDHPLTRQLENCHSVNSVMDVLQQQARALTELRGDDGKAMKSLKRAVDVLHALSTSTILGEGIGLVRWMPFIRIVGPSRLFYSHSLLQNQYSQHLASYSLSVMPIPESHISLTLESIRQSRTLEEATMRLSTCFRLSNTS